jgi:hypothetical protein
MLSNALIGIAGVHFVAMELSRRGLIALPTTRNTSAYDILAMNVEGTHHANVQVKASGTRVSFFPMPAPEKVRTGRHDYYVLVRWLEREQRYEAFLLRGREAKVEVEASLKKQNARVGTTRKASSSWPVIEISPYPKKALKWAKAWKEWTL